MTRTPPLLETIKCLDGELFNLRYHAIRFNNARREFFSATTPIDLASQIEVSENFRSGLFRCRITYSSDIEKIEFVAHSYPTVTQLKLVEDNTIDYRFKYADRSHLQKLFDQRHPYDDVLIVKNGNISDSFTANPVFFDSENWWTPDTPLLPGTQRARMLDEGKIRETRITPADLSRYEKVGLLNAMQDFSNMPIIQTSDIEPL
jgi:4-amino-4-deoxychorismate lyase